MSELVIDNPGTYVGVKKGMFLVKAKDGSRSEFSPVELSHISVRTRGVGFSVDALALACRFGIEVTVYFRGKPVGKLVSALKGGGVLTKHAQLSAWMNEKGLAVAKAIVEAKLFNQRLVVLQRFREFSAKGSEVARSLEKHIAIILDCMNSLHGANDLDSVRALEARAAASYWQGVGLVLPSEIGFPGRVAWSPNDGFNKALNIGYGVLRSRVWSAVLSANLDPFIGFLHLPRGRHMCLVSDLMEEFRPGVVDRTLIALAVEKPSLFLDEKMLERNVVTVVLQTLQKNGKFFERAIVEQARRLASFLRGDVDVYRGFRMRW